jgi:general L-amino acid transport system permease protein
MATMTDPQGESFRLSQLIYDTRYRSMTIQVVALIGFMLFAAWLINNTLENLANQGKDLGFDFLGQPAGYDINQQPIPYDSTSTHLRASVVGLLNTLIVAVLGCITATIIGVLVGVARLSPNWLVARLMAVYVEMFRNVPVLLWIVLVMAVLIEGLPSPRDFRGDDATAQMSAFDSVAVTNRGVYIPKPVLTNGLGTVTNDAGETVSATGGALEWLIVIAVFAASIAGVLAIRRWSVAKLEATGDLPSTWWMQLGVLILPVAVVLFLFGLVWEYPVLEGFNFSGGLHLRNSLIALWLALSLYTAAFIAEIVRAGIMAISRGQTEAAAALGLRPKRIMNLVILPQALRVIIPPLISNYLNLTKNSSLAIAVGYMDITGTLGGITLNQTGRELECILLLMLVYLTISLVISAVMNWYNNSVKLVER